MPRDGSITAGDLVGKIEYLTLACEKCGRAGRYRVDRLLDQLGHEGKLTDLKVRLTADCPQVRPPNSMTNAGPAIRTSCPYSPHDPRRPHCRGRRLLLVAGDCRADRGRSDSRRGRRHDEGAWPDLAPRRL